MATSASEISLIQQLIPLALILPSKHNPRKKFENIDELAENIVKHGVIEPVLVRPVGDKFEMVCGERRLRASGLAGKTDIPAIVRELTDDEAAELRIVENLQRQDLSPWEEAQAYKALGGSAADIGAKVGKDVQYIVSRLRLTTLVKRAHQALDRGLILLGHALELCKLRPEEQEQAMVWLVSHEEQVQGSEGWERLKTPYSVTALQRFIASHFLLVLKNAPFDTTDPKLNPKMGACVDCQYNTANLGTLFAVKDARCTVPDCFAIKTRASVEEKIETAQAAAKKVEKKVVLLGIGHPTRIPKDAIKPELFWTRHDKSVVSVEKGSECEFTKAAIVVWIDPGEAAADLQVGLETQICEDPGCKVHHPKESRSATLPLKGLAKVEHKESILSQTRNQRVREAIFVQLVGKLVKAKPGSLIKAPAGTLTALIEYVASHVGYDGMKAAAKALELEPKKKDGQPLPDWAKALVDYFNGNPDAFVLACLAASELTMIDDPDNALYVLAKEHRVDVAKVKKNVAAEDKATIANAKTKAKESEKAKAAKEAKAKTANEADAIPGSKSQPTIPAKAKKTKAKKAKKAKK